VERGGRSRNWREREDGRRKGKGRRAFEQVKIYDYSAAPSNCLTTTTQNIENAYTVVNWFLRN